MQNTRSNFKTRRKVKALLGLTLMLLLAACGQAPQSAETQPIQTPKAPLENTAIRWEKVAEEKKTFAVTGTQIVRYGAGTRWLQKSVAGTGYCGNWFFGGDPATGVKKTCEVQLAATAPTPTPTTTPAPETSATWVKIADEKTSFTVSGTKMVRFGADTRWVEKSVTGSGDCNRFFFNNGVDPAPGVFKRCEVFGNTSSPTPQPTPPTPNNPTPSNPTPGNSPPSDPTPTTPAPTEPSPPPATPTPAPGQTLPTPAASLSGIGFLGDSNTELYYLVSQKKDYANLVGQALEVRTRNYGEGGQTTRVYLGAERMRQWKAGNYAYYVITFGLNDAGRVSTAQFKRDTLELIAQVESIGAVPILVSNVHVDNKGGHYPWDYNVQITSYDNMYREIARETGVAFIDVNQVFKTMNAAYNAGDRSTISLGGADYQLWDTRIRNTPRGAPLVLTNAQDNGKDAMWFLNIHYNAYGSRIVGDQIVQFFRDNKVRF
jgi:hypothetical protein